MTAVLEISKLEAGYGPLRVLHGIDLSVAQGERVGILGLNGHGKTTMLRSVVDLVDWRQGDILFEGESIMQSPTYALARRGNVLMPHGDALFPGLSVKDNLDSGAYPGGMWRKRKERRDYVCEIFPRLGERLNQIVGTLSGGERRMCSIGRGLMSEARLYLVDEPSLGLGPGVAKGICDTLMTLDLQGGALLIAEQNRLLIDGKVDRVLRMHGGELAPDTGEDGIH
jgi:branched-chain amino acid transport system ATP-binding protein